MKTLKGKLSICKMHFNKGDDVVEIHVEDESSAVHFLTVKVGLESFAKALLGLSYIPVEFELGGTENVGKTLETKTEEVAVTFRGGKSISVVAAREAVYQFEVDGWLGNDADVFNHHNWLRLLSKTKQQVYRVSYHRWV